MESQPYTLTNTSRGPAPQRVLKNAYGMRIERSAEYALKSRVEFTEILSLRRGPDAYEFSIGYRPLASLEHFLQLRFESEEHNELIHTLGDMRYSGLPGLADSINEFVQETLLHPDAARLYDGPKWPMSVGNNPFNGWNPVANNDILTYESHATLTVPRESCRELPFHKLLDKFQKSFGRHSTISVQYGLGSGVPSETQDSE